DAQDIVPALGLTQLDERQSTQPAISDQRTVGFPQRLLDSRKQRAHNLPEPLVPFLLAWHHFPSQGQHAWLLQQAHIPHLRIPLKRREIEHQHHFLLLPRSADFVEKVIPDRFHL